MGVAFDAPGRRKVLIFDPKTYELLGENEGSGGSADHRVRDRRLAQRASVSAATASASSVGGSAAISAAIRPAAPA